jgi:hypothetical protein
MKRVVILPLRENDIKMACKVCGDARWVCEDHKDKPWGGASDRRDACHCGGAGMPCPGCNLSDRERKPKMPRGYTKVFGRDGWVN